MTPETVADLIAEVPAPRPRNPLPYPRASQGGLMPTDGRCMACGAQVGRYRLANCPNDGQKFCEQCGQCECLARPEKVEDR